MKYYVHHIRDFNNATRHLTRIERSVYRDMIELYYDTEEPLPLDIAALCRKVVARTEEEKSAVLALLDEFFTETPEGWRNERCDEDVAVAAVKMEDEEARQENERERQRRHRARRKELFERLREFDDVPAYDTKTEVLQQRLDTHLSRVTSQRQTPDATANHNPEPITHNPIEESLGASAQTGAEGDAAGDGEPDDFVLEASGSEQSTPPKPEYPEDFEQAWEAYPARHGGNPKKDAFKHWSARRREGVPAEDMLAGVERYAAHLKATGKIGSEYVMQAVRFFGTSRQYAEPWPVGPAPQQAKPNGRPSINAVADLGADDPFNNFRRA